MVRQQSGGRIELRTRDPFGEVVETLRHLLRSGELDPGAPLIVMDLAATLHVSATPVREALAYLAGEGLVEGRLGQVRGYFTHRVGPADLADLLRLHQAQVLTGLTEAMRRKAAIVTPSGGMEHLGEAEARVARTEAFFSALVASGGGMVLRRSHRLIAERLHLVRRREDGVLADLDGELQRLVAGASGPAAGGLIRTYHRRRLAEAVRLAALI